MLQPRGRIVVGAQVCFTSPIAQTITFDWSTIITNNVTDPVTYSVNALTTVLATSTTTGTVTNLSIPLNGVFCLKVQTYNLGTYSNLSVSNIRLSGVSLRSHMQKQTQLLFLTCQ